MGRNQNNTMDYFPHIAEPGKTIYILEEKFGNDGYAFWFKILELLCRAENHYLDCSDPTTWQYLLAKTRVDEISGEKMLVLLSFLGQIDQELWEQHKVIWCQKLVNNFAEVYAKRKRPLPTRPVLDNKEHISVPEIHENKDTWGENGSKPAFPPQKSEQNNISAPEMRQSKVNKSKVNNIINTPLPPFAGGAAGVGFSEKVIDKNTGEILEDYSPKETQGITPLNNSSDPPATDNNPDELAAKITKAYKENIGPINGMVADGIRDWLSNFPAEWILEAIREAVLNGVRKPKYINAVLENWNSNGFKAKPRNKDAPQPDSMRDTARSNIENQISIRVRQEIVRNEKSGKRESMDNIRARVRREVEAEYAESGCVGSI